MPWNLGTSGLSIKHAGYRVLFQHGRLSVWCAVIGHDASLDCLVRYGTLNSIRRCCCDASQSEEAPLQAMQGAEDDDSWMRDGADDLERELAARQAELAGKPAASSGNGFDPDGLAQRFKVCSSLALSSCFVSSDRMRGMQDGEGGAGVTAVYVSLLDDYWDSGASEGSTLQAYVEKEVAL